MALAVYSTRFLEIAGLNGSAVYTCPPGFRAVLRDLDAYANVTVASRELHVIGNAGQTIWWQSWSTEDQFSSHLELRYVFDPGESITLQTSDLIDVTASGYLLTLP